MKATIVNATPKWKVSITVVRGVTTGGVTPRSAPPPKDPC